MEVLEWLLNSIGELSGIWAYGVVFGLLLACGMGLPLPEDITLIAGGWMAYQGNADPIMMVVVSFFGVMMGDSAIFTIGSRWGTKILKTRYFSRFLSAERLAHAQRQLVTRGNKLIFFARFMPGLRAPIYFTSGTLQLPFRTFFFFDGVAALISVPAIVLATYSFGSEVENVINVVRRFEYGILILVGSVVTVLGVKWWIAKKKQSKLRDKTVVAQDNGV